jgi:hypothetical protein
VKDVAGGKLLWMTWTLTAVAASGATVDLILTLLGHWIRITNPGAILKFILSLYAVYWFLLWVSGKIVCLILAVLIVVVFFNRTIPPKTRLVTAAAGFAACCLLLFWIGIVKHQW